MRYDGNHKAESRRKIVRAAARQIRRRGPAHVGVAEVMGEAGLTHGAFYAHFPSKEALVAEAVDAIFDEPRRLTQVLDTALADGKADVRGALADVVASYLSTAHRDTPERGCPLTSLASDMARDGGAPRVRFAAGAERLADRIAQVLARIGVADPAAEANAVLAQMVGAVTLARAIGSSEWSDAILHDARTAVVARFGL